MGLLTGILLAPLAPVRGVAWIAAQLEQEAARQSDGPIQGALADLDRQAEAGELSAEEAALREEELLERLLYGAEPGGGSHG